MMLSAVSRLPVSSSPTLSAAASSCSESDGTGSATGELSDKEQQKVDELKARDTEVRTHERAHASVGGAYASAPSFELTQGPDGKSYAISGDVQIDTAPESDAEATIAKMNVVIAAALAPAEPSAADRAVAAKSKQILAIASADAREEKALEQSGEGGDRGQGAMAPAIAAYEATERLVTGAEHSVPPAAAQPMGTLFNASA